MTVITVFTDERDRVCRFTVEGHSGYADEGADIVCASISSVVWAAVNGLEQVLRLPISYETRDADVDCALGELTHTERRDADILLESMVAFFKQLTEDYGDYVALRKRKQC